MIKYLFAIMFLCITTNVIAQVAVRNEPRHHLVFENNYVRVLDVYVAPGDTTLYHIHATPSVFIFYSNTANAQQLLGKEPVRSITVDGNVLYDSMLVPRTHRVWVEDTNWLHVMDVELVTEKSNHKVDIIKNGLLQLLFDESQADGYTLKLKAGERIKLPVSATGYLLVSMGDAAVTLQSKDADDLRKMKAGHYEWINAGRSISVINKNASATFTLLQLK